MNNGLKPTKVTINIESIPSFSASMANMRISPVSRVVLGTPEAAFSSKLEVHVVGRCGETEFLKRTDFSKECFSSDSYNLKNTSAVVLDFDYDCFEYDYAFLNSLDEETAGEIIVLVKYAGRELVAKAPIILLPVSEWLGLDGEPSVIASFVKDNDDSIENICKDICENGKVSYSSFSKKNIINTVKSLYKSLKNCNIIYSRPVGYAANAKQPVRFPNELFSAASVLATPLEISLVFCACAKRIGLDSSLIFVRGKKGDISVLCGVYLVKSPIKVPVCEDAQRISDLVDAGDMLIVDPSVFAAAQNTSFVMALENTAENFVNNAQSLVCLVDVKRSLMSAGLYDESDELSGLPVKNAVAKVYSSIVYSPVMQFLSGKQRNDVEEIPLLLPDFDKYFHGDENDVLLRPLDIGVNLDDYAAVDKDFSSILTMYSPKARQHFSSGELAVMKERFDRLLEKIDKENEITTSLRDENLYSVASEMAFGKNKKEPYIAFGYVKITDKLTELVSFAPVCLVRAKIAYCDSNFYVSKYGTPIVNKVFIRNALKDSSLGYDSFMKSLMPTDKKEIFDLFENIRMALAETDDRHIYEIVKEAHIVNVDIDDYVLWSSLALERNKLAQSKSVQRVFSEEMIPEKLNRNYVPSKPLYSESMKAVCADTDVIVEGAFTEEKEKVFSSIAARSITEGKSMLVVTDDMEMSRYVESVLDREGFSDCVYVVGEDGNSSGAVAKIKDNIEKYRVPSEGSVSFVSEELSGANETLSDYSYRLNRKHRLGMSFKAAVEAYLYACSGTENYDNIPVDKSVFKNADEDKLDSVFELVGELISGARNLCKSSGMEKYAPVKSHPLYYTNPSADFDENRRNAVCVAIETALPVLSEFRDVFYDVNDILKFDENEIDSLYKLEKLNDLYKLVLTARDIDIPEKFVESDIADFTRSKKFSVETKKRMEAIEFKLNFFTHEIFEDVDILLKGDEYDEETEKGFIRKFMVKKNSHDMLMQYVRGEKKNDFQHMKLSEIYKLLYEYKACAKKLSENVGKGDDSEETIRLANISEQAAYLIDTISSNEANNKKLLSNVFRLISVVPIDSSLARRITIARARFAELCSGETGVFGMISYNLGLNFDNIRFSDGALSFDGFGKYLERLEENLDSAIAWVEWKELSAKAGTVVPGFVKYLDEHGAGTNVDRIFAKSLLSPVAVCIKEDVMSGLSSEKLARAKEKYAEFLTKACSISQRNVLESYKNSVKHMSEITNAASLENADSCLREFIVPNINLVQKVLPVIIVTKNVLTDALPLGINFDIVAVFDNKYNGYTMLPALGFGEKCVVMNMSKVGRSELCERMSSKLPVYDVCGIVEAKDAAAFTWLNSKLFNEACTCVNLEEKTSIEIVRMNGIYDRTGSRTNRTEVELALVKATGLLQETQKKVAITAFTKEQCTAIERMIHMLSKKNKLLSEALSDGRLSVCTPDRLYMKQYDSLVVSACFGTDKDSRLGWDFGYAGRGASESIPEAYVSIADRKTEKTYFLTSMNVKDSRFIRRTGNNAVVFNSVCEMLAEGRIPVNMKNASADSGEGIKNGVVAGISSRNPRVLPCEGKMPVNFALRSCTENGLFVIFDDENGFSMHDELVIKKKLTDAGRQIITLTPMDFSGDICQETIKSLVDEKDNI